MRIWHPRLKLTSVLIEVNSVVYEQDQCIGTMNPKVPLTPTLSPAAVERE
jgi:hypothetical protein